MRLPLLAGLLRFEQEPAALVANAGTGRLQGLEFIADFVSSSGEPGKFLRERWRLTPEGGLEFDLEAAGEGAGPRRVGGFRATR